MNVTIAIDSMKGSISSLEAGEAVRKGIQKVFPEASIQIYPLADGGEGTADALVAGLGGEWVETLVKNPLGQPVICRYGILKDGLTAVMEMAAAAGITLISSEEKNPMETTTYGVGEMIADAIRRGCRRFMIGIGGSATNDGGIGMLQALGFDFLNEVGEQISFGAKGLAELVQISDQNVIPELAECRFRIACDVTNPLCGEQGCSRIFGSQKGASLEMADQMDEWLKKYAELAQKTYPKAEPNQAGAGAAGGLGFAFLTFTNAILDSGIKIVLEEIGLENDIEKADIIITGEGKLDCQTAMGKAPSGVAQIAKKYQKPVIAFAGMVSEDAKLCNDTGIDAFFPILRRVTTFEEALTKENASHNLTDTAEQVFRLIRCISR